jgi:hypothetical protein
VGLCAFFQLLLIFSLLKLYPIRRKEQAEQTIFVGDLSFF